MEVWITTIRVGPHRESKEGPLPDILTALNILARHTGREWVGENLIRLISGLETNDRVVCWFNGVQAFALSAAKPISMVESVDPDRRKQAMDYALMLAQSKIGGDVNEVLSNAQQIESYLASANNASRVAAETTETIMKRYDQGQPKLPNEGSKLGRGENE